MEQKEIENKFANAENMYYAHGIGAYDEKVVNSIFEYGLRCSHNELYWTVVEFGRGSKSLFRDNEESMSNWKHKGSKHIMIASLPEEFHLLDVNGTALFQKRHAAFYNSISPEQSTEIGIAPGLYLKPEFVMGMYDTVKKDFVVNDRYYENLPEEEQKRVLDDVKKQYMDIIAYSDWTLAEYAQILEDVGIKCPLTPEEIANNGKENEHQSDMIELPNGVRIPRKQYAEEYTVGEEKRTDMVELPNGIKIPKKQYEEEYAVGETKADMVTLSNGVRIPRKQYEEEKGNSKPETHTSNKISGQSLKKDISNGNVTTSETQQQTKAMDDTIKIKRLMYKQRSGAVLTDEEKTLIEQHIRQTNEAQVRFRNQQDQKKSKGLEM